MLHLNENTKQITCPRGDTGIFTVTLNGVDGQPPVIPPNSYGVFGICSEQYNVFYPQHSIRCPIENNTVTVHITPAFSRGISPGEYFWDVRVVTDAASEFDERGLPVTDEETDEVHSLYAGTPEGMPKYVVPGVAVDIGGILNG